MAQISTFFNSKNHDRKYNADNWADYFTPLFRTGVFDGCLFVQANNNMSITVQTGYAWINGRGYHNTENLPLDIETASGNLNRIDAVKIKLDLTNRLIEAYVDKGSNAAEPTAPENVRNDTIYELTIAEINIAAGTTAITQSKISDTRMDNTICGLVTGAVEQINFEQIYQQFRAYFEEQGQLIAADVRVFEADIAADKAQADVFLEDFKQYLQNYTGQQQAEFEEWVETIQDILDEETAGHLLLLIQDLQSRVTVLENMALNNTIMQEIKTDDNFVIVTDNEEIIGATKIFATL